MGENTAPGSIRSVEPADDQDPTAAVDVSVVGVGASAGGLEAFSLLLADLPADTGLAFVLVQHLDPTRKSNLSEILGRATTMPVREAGDGLMVERNRVYVIPPNTELTIVDRVLKLSPHSQTQEPHLPIDHFLRSLAQDCGTRAIAVILSGSSSDGLLGVQAVKEAGGVTFAQEPASAEFPSMLGMPDSAGCVDFVLPLEGIAAELARIAQHPRFAVAGPRELDLKNRALPESRNPADSIVETVQIPLLTLDKDLRIRTVNESFSKAFLIPQSDAVGQLFYSLGKGIWNIPGLRALLDRVLSANESFDNFEVEWTFPSIGTRDLNINAHRVDQLDLILVAIDSVTRRKGGERALQKREETLRQAQKMEAIGRLAGGIAHDFSNSLTAILGYSHLIADSLDGGHEAIEYVQEIEKAALRAAALTDQLLAFSRRKILLPKVFDVNTVVVDFERLLHRILGERIKFVFRPAPDLWRVRADAGEIGRALMNLCLNARDAMPAGGTLTIETANATIGDTEIHPHNLGAGQYVELNVRDTGSGMDRETQTRVFEPFFTTKESTKGTGLGLATVLGIVEQSGGAIWFDSELGQGTKFKILLPAITVEADQDECPPDSLAPGRNGSGEVVLLVEDEDQVRKLASRILQSRGYVVLEAKDGREGLSVCEAHQGKIDLLLSDVVMPEFGGREFAERVLTRRPDIKVLFMSGHTQDVILKEGIKGGTPFLQKPFLPTELAHQVRRVLDSQVRSFSAKKA
jgi:signal transduction histidine kinase/chemotaxis response regulator CheB